MHWTEKSEKLQYWKPKTKLEKTCKLHKPLKLKTADFKCENEKAKPKIGKVCKTENPNALFLKKTPPQEKIFRALLDKIWSVSSGGHTM